MTISNQPQQQPQYQRLISWLFWLISAAYIYVLLLSPPQQILPGEPIWAIQPQTLQELWNQSVNFFFILPILNVLGIKAIPDAIAHPLLESLFNFALAWMFMFLPLLLADPRGYGLPKVLIWGLAMFLTNVFLCPYMAIRATKPPIAVGNKNLLARVFGWIGLVIGIIALIWSILGRPEFGDISTRGQYFVQSLISDRMTIAFCVDLVFFTVFQAVLMGDIEPQGSNKRWLRFVPFWGLAVWLII
jgi:hypothetical protein